jgi:tetratricopeptide (TPR) repeat protein
LTWHIDQLGATSVYRFVRDRRSGGPANAPARGTDDIVDASHVHLVDFGIGPDEAARLAAGSHRVRAVLALPSNSSGATHLVSNVVEIAVQASTAADDDTQRLESAAQFYLRSEKWEDAHRIARQLVGRQQPDASAYLLLGDALNGLRRDAESLAAYEAALAALPAPLAESPHYLFARMDEVQQRLEASKGKKEP